MVHTCQVRPLHGHTVLCSFHQMNQQLKPLPVSQFPAVNDFLLQHRWRSKRLWRHRRVRMLRGRVRRGLNCTCAEKTTEQNHWLMCGSVHVQPIDYWLLVLNQFFCKGASYLNNHLINNSREPRRIPVPFICRTASVYGRPFRTKHIKNERTHRCTGFLPVRPEVQPSVTGSLFTGSPPVLQLEYFSLVDQVLETSYLRDSLFIILCKFKISKNKPTLSLDKLRVLQRLNVFYSEI